MQESKQAISKKASWYESNTAGKEISARFANNKARSQAR